MRHLPTLLRRELQALLLAPSTYLAAVAFLLLQGLFFFKVVELYVLEAQTGEPMSRLFQLFWLPTLFLVPLLTMRSLAEERRLGTLESLLTAPITVHEMVVAKFLAAWAFYMALWVLVLVFPMAAGLVLGARPEQALFFAPAPLLGGLLFVGFSGLFFVAAGVLASSLTRSQLVAGMLCFSFLFISLLGPQILLSSTESWLPQLAAPLDFMDVFQHLDDFSRGIVDSRPLAYYGGLAAGTLGLAVLVTESKV